MVTKPIATADLVARRAVQWERYKRVLGALTDAYHHEVVLCIYQGWMFSG